MSSFDLQQCYEGSDVQEAISFRGFRQMFHAYCPGHDGDAPLPDAHQRHAFEQTKQQVLQISDEIDSEIHENGSPADIAARQQQAYDTDVIRKIFFRRQKRNPPPSKVLFWRYMGGHTEPTGKRSQSPTGMNVEQLSRSREPAPDEFLSQREEQQLLQEVWSYSDPLKRIAAISDAELLHACQQQALEEAMQELEDKDKQDTSEMLRAIGEATYEAEMQSQSLSPSRRSKHPHIHHEAIGKRFGKTAAVSSKTWQRFTAKVKSRVEELYRQHQIAVA